ncbi:MAG: hypothetical protein ACKO9Q_07550, partial [Pirellula sp.]
MAQDTRQSGINTPIEELTSGVIDNRRIYNTFVNRGRRLITDEPELDSKDIRQKVTQAPSRLAVSLPDVAPIGSDVF